MQNDILIPYIAFESATARLERTIKRLWITIIILILTILAVNLGWLYYESTFEIIETTQVSQDIEAVSEGNDIKLTTVGGDFYYGE